MDPRQTAETFNTVQPALFWLVALLTGFCAVATVISQNIVRSATWLLFTLAGTSAVFFLLGADLVGATQLLVYVGGTLVLVIFGVMLTAQGPFVSMKTSGAEWAISVVAGFLLMTVLATAVLTPNVLVGPPLVKTTEVIPDGPGKGEKHVLYRTPEVKRFAPPFSRAERQIKGGRPVQAAPPEVSTKGGAGGPGGPGGPMPAGPGGFGPPGDLKGKGKGFGMPPGGKGPGAGGPGTGAFAGGGKKGGEKKGKGQPEPQPAGKGEPKVGMPPVGDMQATMPLTPTLEIKDERPAPIDPATSPQSATLGQGFVGVGVGPAHPSPRGIVRANYLLPFEIVSVHLLVVLVGAAYLARAKRRREGVS